jgi:hypothetical protein
MQGGKNWILLKEINANRFFRDSHWLEIGKNYLCPSMGPNGGSVAMYSVPKDILIDTRKDYFLAAAESAAAPLQRV